MDNISRKNNVYNVYKCRKIPALYLIQVTNGDIHYGRLLFY
jgi:hypothetical protein